MFYLKPKSCFENIRYNIPTGNMSGTYLFTQTFCHGQDVTRFFSPSLSLLSWVKLVWIQLSFFKTDCLISAKEPNLSYLPIAGREKCKQPHPGFELWSLIPFPPMITYASVPPFILAIQFWELKLYSQYNFVYANIYKVPYCKNVSKELLVKCDYKLKCNSEYLLILLTSWLKYTNILSSSFFVFF